MYLGSLGKMHVVIDSNVPYTDNHIGHYVIIEKKHWIFQVIPWLKRQKPVYWIVKGAPIYNRIYETYQIENNIVCHPSVYKEIQHQMNLR
jgi:hypothetical protein